ncbi:ABC transporter ATP-binding protein [Bacillus sp. Hm123]|uniref:ABC transporter ATP-binding protein n=1 Tax=Bacillus sp. Hm123 TaxID=3450745 RepID=UPI003F42DEB9
MNSDEILVVKDLVKEIDGRKIIQNLSFSVKKGQIFGFLGPNGSGKTTTIRMMTGMIQPTMGSVQIMGYDVQKEFSQAMQNLGAIVEHPSLFNYMTGWQNLIQSVRLLDTPPDMEYIKWCVETVELTDRIHDKVKSYSLGMKQRLAIAQSLISSPKILILDEPTNGMDPSGIKDMRILIKNLAYEHQITIFLSSHLLSEIENLCDHVLIINKGKQVVSGLVDELIQQNHSEFKLTVDKENVNIAYDLIKSKNITVHPYEDYLIVQGRKGEIPHLINELYKNGVGVYLINQKESSLEDYFISVTQEVNK